MRITVGALTFSVSRAGRSHPPPRRKFYPSYEAALSACAGYEDSRLLDVIKAKTEALRESGDEGGGFAASEPEVHGLLSLLIAEAAQRCGHPCEYSISEAPVVLITTALNSYSAHSPRPFSG